MSAAIVSGLQYDRLVGLLGDDLPPAIATPLIRLTHPTPHRRERISDEVYLDVTPADAEVLQALVWTWMTTNLAVAETTTDSAMRRRIHRFAAALNAANYRICTAARVPVAVTFNATWIYARKAPPTRRAAISVAYFTASTATTSARWVTQHRIMARAMEAVPSPAHHLRHQALAKPLPVGRGTKRVAVPAWWTLLAPTAPFRHLPTPGEDGYEAALRWYSEARTTTRVADLADTVDEVGWALDWSVRLLARCLDPDEPRQHFGPIRSAMEDVIGAGDPFDGAPLSPIDLWADPAMTRVSVSRDEVDAVGRDRRRSDPGTIDPERSHV